jgi:hypothetical protein
MTKLHAQGLALPRSNLSIHQGGSFAAETLICSKRYSSIHIKLKGLPLKHANILLNKLIVNLKKKKKKKLTIT